MKKMGKRVVFIHPDLGIGGAERLVVDAAVALKSKGHAVTVVTGHHDKSHCFPETLDGRVGQVVTVGDWIPRNILGRFHAVLASIRMLYATAWLIFASKLNPELIICDQVSTQIAMLKLFWPSVKIIFYCHFPDQLLSKRDSVAKSIYRRPLDYIEELTTGMADLILVNSKFTRGIFQQTFKSLSHVSPKILYPTLNSAYFDQLAAKVGDPEDSGITFLSLNRFERKKNVALAIEAFALLVDKFQQNMDSRADRLRLVVAGGYDERVEENVQHFKELSKLVEQRGLGKSVSLVTSPSDAAKVELFKHSVALLYTPSGEHFGIVPVEAMYCGLPVIAVNNGGPLETVVDGVTGFLREDTPDAFAEAMGLVLASEDRQEDMKTKVAESGPQRVKTHFSFASFSEQLDSYVSDVLSN